MIEPTGYDPYNSVERIDISRNRWWNYRKYQCYEALQVDPIDVISAAAYTYREALIMNGIDPGPLPKP